MRTFWPEHKRGVFCPFPLISHAFHEPDLALKPHEINREAG